MIKRMGSQEVYKELVLLQKTYETSLTPVIIGKLPPDLHLSLSRKLCEEWDLNSLLKALGTQLNLREKCSLTSGASTTSSRPREERSQPSYYRNNPRQPTTTSTLHSNTENIPCSFCKRAHFSASCTIATDPEERRKILRRKTRCFFCLRSGHVSRDCKSEKGCYRCHGRHHTALCSGRVITESDSFVAVNAKHQAQSGGKLYQQCVPQPQRVDQAGNGGVSGQQPVSTNFSITDRRHGSVLLRTASAVVSQGWTDVCTL